MVLQNPKTSQQYAFEIKDRLIRDNETDGWKEVPVKPDTASHRNEADLTSDNASTPETPALPGALVHQC